MASIAISDIPRLRLHVLGINACVLHVMHQRLSEAFESGDTDRARFHALEMTEPLADLLDGLRELDIPIPEEQEA